MHCRRRRRRGIVATEASERRCRSRDLFCDSLTRSGNKFHLLSRSCSGSTGLADAHWKQRTRHWGVVAIIVRFRNSPNLRGLPTVEALGFRSRRQKERPDPVGSAVDPALVQATEPRTHLTTVVEAAHAQHVPVIASGVDDEETLAGVRQSGVDFAAGSFIQPPSINMDFTFEPCEEEA